MFWFIKKLDENKDRLLYSYSRESKLLDGVIEFEKNTSTSNCVKYADGDDDFYFSKLAPMFNSVVIKENAPDSYLIAIG